MGGATAFQFQGIVSPNIKRLGFITGRVSGRISSWGSNCSTLSGTGWTAQQQAENQRACQDQYNAINIFILLYNAGVLSNVTNAVTWNGINSYGPLTSPYSQAAFDNFTSAYESQFPCSSPFQSPSCTDLTLTSQINYIQSRINGDKYSYKLFYTTVANPGINGTNQAAPQYSLTPPTCASHPCKDKELSSDLVLGGVPNTNGDLMFDYLRNGASNKTLENPPPPGVPMNLRPYMAWQWAATAGTGAALIGLNTSNGQFPSYDIDGRLKEVTIYGIRCCDTYGDPTVTYSDPQAGDIDGSWDVNSCTPKPGLQSNAQVYSFTQNGTYLQIKEGKLFNPETGLMVRRPDQS